MCKRSDEVSVDSQRLSKLASAFEESLRISRDSDKSEKCSRSVADSERQSSAADTREESADVSVMERCLAAMAQSDSHPCEDVEAEDDDDCSSLLASLSDLQTQLQHEIRQTQRLHGPAADEPQTTTDDTSVTDTSTHLCDQFGEHTSATTTAATSSTAETTCLPAPAAPARITAGNHCCYSTVNSVVISTVHTF